MKYTNWGYPHPVTVFCDPVKGILCGNDKVCVLNTTHDKPGSDCKEFPDKSCDFDLADPQFVVCQKIGNSFKLKTECDALKSGTESEVGISSSPSDYKNDTGDRCKRKNRLNFCQ